ncbi:MAG: citrate lyase subunit beta/citryl-CoA lyase [Paracoccaceae bacterium]|jgi:citrate lyase subunit beta/citryl-CoA lyase
MVKLNRLRAPLFIPGNRPDLFIKGATSGADAVILDLEDSVGAEEKTFARASLSDCFTELPIIVRVNAAGTNWHYADINAVKNRKYAAIMLPKCECPKIVASVIAASGGLIPLFAIIESAAGLAHARAIAALEGVERLAFGSVDYCADLHCAHHRDILLSARLELVLASRLAEISAPIDGVTTQLDDLSITTDDAEHARNVGMGGKLCIHPKQIHLVQRAFASSQQEIDWAQRVLASSGGVLLVDGEMVDEPVRLRARQIMEAVLDVA